MTQMLLDRQIPQLGKLWRAYTMQSLYIAVVLLALVQGALGTWQFATATGASYMGRDIRAVGTFGPSDGTRMMELGQYEMELKRRQAEAMSPDTLARLYHQKAGHPPALLEEVAPLLSEADKNATLEKQLTHSPLPPN